MILTSTVKISSESAVVVPVKTTKHIKYESIEQAMKIISLVEVKAPVKIGDVVIKDFIEKGIDLVITKNIL